MSVNFSYSVTSEEIFWHLLKRYTKPPFRWREKGIIQREHENITSNTCQLWHPHIFHLAWMSCRTKGASNLVTRSITSCAPCCYRLFVSSQCLWASPINLHPPEQGTEPIQSGPSPRCLRLWRQEITNGYGQTGEHRSTKRGRGPPFNICKLPLSCPSW